MILDICSPAVMWIFWIFSSVSQSMKIRRKVNKSQWVCCISLSWAFLLLNQNCKIPLSTDEVAFTDLHMLGCFGFFFVSLWSLYNMQPLKKPPYICFGWCHPSKFLMDFSLFDRKVEELQLNHILQVLQVTGGWGGLQLENHKHRVGIQL